MVYGTDCPTALEPLCVCGRREMSEYLGDTPHTVHKLSKCLPSPTYLDAVNTFPTLTCGSLTAYLCVGVCVCCGFDGADSTNKQSAKLSEAGKYVY